MKHTLPLLLLAGLFTLPALADEPSSTNQSPLIAALTVNYDSKYVLYGYRQDGPLLGTDIYLGYPVSESTTLWGGSWFGIIPNGTYREWDAYVGLDRSLSASIAAGIALSAFRYIEAPFTDETITFEIAGHLTYQDEHLSLSFRQHVENKSDGTLSRLIASYTQPVTERVALRGVAEFGYAFGYYIHGNRPNHALLRVELPLALRDTLSFTPFIARSIALSAIDSFEEDDTYGGAELTWTF